MFLVFCCIDISGSRYNCLLFIVPCVPGFKMYISLSPYLYVYYEANKMESNQAQRYIWTWFYKTVQINIILSFQKWKINFVIGICLIHKIIFSYLDIFIAQKCFSILNLTNMVNLFLSANHQILDPVSDLRSKTLFFIFCKVVLNSLKKHLERSF